MAWRRSRVRIPYAPLTKKQGNPTGTASFLAFFMLFSLLFCRFWRSICHICHKNLVTDLVTKSAKPPPDFPDRYFSDAPYLDIFRPGVFLKCRFRLTEQLIERNLFLKAIDHRQNISRILREHGAGGIRHGRAENPLVIG